MYRKRTVSVVFPAYNEEAGIAGAVKEFKAIEAVDKVYVIDNNSTDGTASLARSAGAIVICEPRQGYGHALRRGLKEADTDYIVLCEPDGTFMAEDVYKLLSYAHQFKMVMGTRTTRELIWRAANMNWFLRWGNYFVAKVLQLLFNGPSLSDCGCTFRLVRRDLALEINPALSVGASHFLPEMVILALLSRAPIIEIPLNYRGRIGQSKITGHLSGIVRTGTMMLLLIVRYRLEQLVGLKKKLPIASRADDPSTF
jgi:glycosyltransferase involved in cell wall biosynthesis